MLNTINNPNSSTTTLLERMNASIEADAALRFKLEWTNKYGSEHHEAELSRLREECRKARLAVRPR